MQVNKNVNHWSVSFYHVKKQPKEQQYLLNLLQNRDKSQFNIWRSECLNVKVGGAYYVYVPSASIRIKRNKIKLHKFNSKQYLIEFVMHLVYAFFVSLPLLLYSSSASITCCNIFIFFSAHHHKSIIRCISCGKPFDCMCLYDFPQKLTFKICNQTLTKIK